MNSHIPPVKCGLVAAIALVIATSWTTTVLAAQDTVAPRMTAVEEKGRITGFIVYLDGTADPASWSARLSAAFDGGSIVFRHVRTLATGGEFVSIDRAGLDPDEANRLMVQATGDPSVRHIEADIRLYALSTNDPRWAQQWSYHDARTGSDVPVAWKRTRGAGAVVAVIDTGITSHEDLAGQVLPGYDFISDVLSARDGDGRDGNPADEGDWSIFGGSSWHGTHVSGTIVALANNAIGMAGVAPEAKVVPVRMLGANGGTVADIADAMIWAAGGKVAGVPDNPNPAHVLNLSLGGAGACGRTMSDAIQRARELGAAVIVAAGNSAANVSGATPANCPGVIAVAASGRDGSLARYSNFGQGIALTAPGGSGNGIAENDIVSTLNAGRTTPAGPTYAFYAGTSMATPHVAGVAALMRSLNPGLTPDQIAEYLRDTTRPMPVACTKGCGTGLLDAGAAVDAVAAEL